jgi:hypothetical protein
MVTVSLGIEAVTRFGLVEPMGIRAKEVFALLQGWLGHQHRVRERRLNVQLLRNLTLVVHLADEQITDAEALLAFRRRLQVTFYPDYADTLSVQVLLADLSEVRRDYLRDWLDREESTGRFLSVDKEWLEYRVGHADIHCQRVQAELQVAEEERLGRFQEQGTGGGAL